MELGKSKKDVEVFPMTDGQLLVLVDGLTHTTYMQESAEAYRVVVGNQTVVFEIKPKGDVTFNPKDVTWSLNPENPIVTQVYPRRRT